MKAATLPTVLLGMLLLSGCSSPHRLAGIWQLDKGLEVQAIDKITTREQAARIIGNPAVADNVTISFTSHRITWLIEAGGVRYNEYSYTRKSADAHSVEVVQTNPATGASQDVVYHFESDSASEIMWTSDPDVNKALGSELRIYFRPAVK